MQVLNLNRIVSIPEDAWYIGRPNKKSNWKGSALQNSYILNKHGNREQCCAKYRQDLWKWIQAYKPGTKLSPELEELKQVAINKPDLVCYCAPLSCHGDIICRAITWLTEGEGQSHPFYINEIAPALKQQS